MSEQHNNWLPTVSEHYRGHGMSKRERAAAGVTDGDDKPAMPEHLDTTGMSDFNAAGYSKKELEAVRKLAREFNFEEFGWELTNEARQAVQERAQAAEDAARALVEAMPAESGLNFAGSADEFVATERRRAANEAVEAEVATLQPQVEEEYRTKRDVKEFEAKKRLYRRVLEQSDSEFEDLNEAWKVHEQMRYASEMKAAAKEAIGIDQTIKNSTERKKALDAMSELDPDGELSVLVGLGFDAGSLKAANKAFAEDKEKYFERVKHLTTADEAGLSDEDKKAAKKYKDAKAEAEKNGIDSDQFMGDLFLKGVIDRSGMRSAVKRAVEKEGAGDEAAVEAAYGMFVDVVTDEDKIADMLALEGQLRKYKMYAQRRANALQLIASDAIGTKFVSMMNREDEKAFSGLRSAVQPIVAGYPDAWTKKDLSDQRQTRLAHIKNVGQNEGPITRFGMRTTVEAHNAKDRTEAAAVASRERVTESVSKKRELMNRKFGEFLLWREFRKK